MLITSKLLKEWGACERYREVFAKEYPNGVTGTAAEIAAIPEYECDQWWVEMAVRLSGKDGEDALRLATERVDLSRLASLVLRVKDKDTSAAYARLKASKDIRGLYRVARKGESKTATDARAELERTIGAERLQRVEAEYGI